MTRIALILAAVAVAIAGGGIAMSGWFAGDPADLVACEEATKAVLKAPATYKRVETTRQAKPEFSRIYLQYDAVNTYGAPLRGMAICEYPAGTTAETWQPRLVAHQVNGQRVFGPVLNFSSSR